MATRTSNLTRKVVQQLKFALSLNANFSFIGQYLKTITNLFYPEHRRLLCFLGMAGNVFMST
jgi:hypothetical protein